MDENEIKKIQGIAKSVAITWGYSELADDFAQEAVMYFISRGKTKIEWLLIDHLRREYGSSRTISGRIRQSAEKYAVRLDAPVSEDDSSGLNHDIVGCSENGADELGENRGFDIPYGLLRGREAEITVMYFQQEMTHEQIGKLFGITNLRVSQIIKEVTEKMKPILENKKLREKTEADDHFMEIKLR